MKGSQVLIAILALIAIGLMILKIYGSNIPIATPVPSPLRASSPLPSPEIIIDSTTSPFAEASAGAMPVRPSPQPSPSIL